MSERLERGQVWRTRGPCGWIRIESVVLPGRPEYDGGAPGVQYRSRSREGKWGQSWFMVARDEAHALEQVTSHTYRRFLTQHTPPDSTPSIHPLTR